LQRHATLAKRNVRQLSEAMVYQISGIGKKSVEELFAAYSSVSGLMDALERSGDSVAARTCPTISAACLPA
jgi:ERCC4-type nuclease